MVMIVRFYRYKKALQHPQLLENILTGGKIDTSEEKKKAEDGKDIFGIYGGKRLNINDLKNICKEYYLTLEGVQIDPTDIEKKLLMFGPLVYFGQLVGYRGVSNLRLHAVVISGVITDHAPLIVISDPWQARLLKLEFEKFFKEFYPVAVQGNRTFVICCQDWFM
jgi:hypothetical protein